MQKTPCVYILSNTRRGTLYIGVTSNLIQRVWQHKNDLIECFSKKYQTHNLVWYEVHETMESAIQREKVLKFWKRLWKIQMIEKRNSEWRDLYTELM